jgi:hypothetical protein
MGDKKMPLNKILLSLILAGVLVAGAFYMAERDGDNLY